MTQSTQLRVPVFTVGDRLRKAREAIGLDRQTFAAELGISRTSLAKYEGSATPPGKTVLMAWSMRTGVPIEWLIEGVDPQHDGGPGGGLPHLDSNQKPFGLQPHLDKVSVCNQRVVKRGPASMPTAA